MAAPKTPPSTSPRRSPILDFSDASERLTPGFGEAPQAGFEGAPLAGPLSGWADEIAREADEQAERAADIGTVEAETRPAEMKAPRKPRSSGAAKDKPGKTARGTSMGGSNDPKTRAAAGLNPVAGMDVSLEDAAALPEGGMTATVEALSKLISEGNPLIKNGEVWLPHRPARPDKSEGGIRFTIKSDFEPAGDQPTAIRDLVAGIQDHDQTQVLLGVTGSGKTFTVAKVIEATQRPALILAPNKTLAAQLYGEFKNFFPDNAVEYFVSYYDYYQPEAYVPRSDTFIEKESSINEQIDRMRHAATRSLLERDDVVIVASVSCIYGIGSVETYTAMTFQMNVGDRLDQRQLLADLVAQQYKRRDMDFVRGSFRVRGDTIEIFPAHLEDRAWRISLFGDEIETIQEFDPLTGARTDDLKSVKIYASSHYVTPRPTLQQAVKSIKIELRQRIEELNRAGRLLEAQRLEQRVTFDVEMIEATGSCAGIENYSRYLTGRQPGHPPPTLFEYLPDNALVFIDESHVTIPQIGAMYRGDFRRKATLAEYGFRLPSCMDNRPLRFEEWNAMRPMTVAVSATPGSWELEESGGVFAEQVIRPTGLTDPPIEIRPARSQVDDLLGEIRETVAKGYRVLVTVLTKRMAEDLTEYLHEHAVKVRYMHSDIETLERIEIIRDLRLGAFDVLVGINLLREGLDIPECGLVAILDADKEGFLRSETSLVQTIGRAARNIDGKVILYADRTTGSMERAIAETNRRRDKQEAFNQANGITPASVKAHIADILDSYYEKDHVRVSTGPLAAEGAMVGNNLKAHLEHLQKAMRDAAADLDFETAARLRDEVKRLQATELAIGADPMARDLEIEGPASGRTRHGGKLKGPAGPALAPGSVGTFERSGPSLIKAGKAARSSGATEDAASSPARKDAASDAASSRLQKDAASDAASSPHGGEGRGSGMRGDTSPSGSSSSLSGSSSSGLTRGPMPSTVQPKTGPEAPTPSYFHKPSIDDMGTGTDTTIPRRDAAERPRRDAAEQGSPALFRKNTLDEMTVGRTEKPLARGPLPQKPKDPTARLAPRSSPAEGAPQGRMAAGDPAPSAADDVRPIRRERAGLGSYEDPGDVKRKGRRTGKTGRPGR